MFNALDANNPAMRVDTVEQRLAAFSMMLTRGVFRRGGTPRADAEWELIAAVDPHGFATVNRLVHWRRSMPTINFPLGSATVNWDGGNSVSTDQRAGLLNQAARNVTGGQQNQPAHPDIIASIVDFESSLFSAQTMVFGVGDLDSDGARGGRGPEAMSTMQKMAGRSDLFDAWPGMTIPAGADLPGAGAVQQSQSGRQPLRRLPQLGEQRHPHQYATFDVGTASAEARTPDLPPFTFRNRTSMRALAARASYFHNGIAATLEEVVRHYERQLGFIFTDEERADLCWSTPCAPRSSGTTASSRGSASGCPAFRSSYTWGK